MLNLPSTLRRSARPFLLFAASARCLSFSSRNSFSLWLRAAAPLILLVPPLRTFTPSSESFCDANRASSFDGEGEPEAVLCLLEASCFLNLCVNIQPTLSSPKTYSSLSLRPRLFRLMLPSMLSPLFSPLLASMARRSCSSSS
jgi:hypothetical protein